MKKLLALVLALVLVLAVFAGCTPKEQANTDNPTNTPSDTSEPDAAEPGDDAADTDADTSDANMVNGLRDANGDGKIVVAGIHKFGDSLWFVTESKAVEETLKAQGVDEYMFLDAKDDGNLYLQLIDTVIAQGVDAVITTPPDQTLSQSVVEKLSNAGIAVLASDDPLADDSGAFLAPWVGIDSFAIGEESARWLIDYMKENGLDQDEECGILLMTTETVTSAVPRTEGQEAAIAEGLPDFPQDRIFRADYKIDLNVAYTAANAIIVANPQITKWMVLATADEGTIGATRALEQAGLDDESCTVALGGYLAPNEFEKGTCCKSTAYFSASEVGTMAANTLIQMLKGEEVPMEAMVGCVMVTPENHKEMMPEYQ